MPLTFLSSAVGVVDLQLLASKNYAGGPPHHQLLTVTAKTKLVVFFNKCATNLSFMPFRQPTNL